MLLASVVGLGGCGGLFPQPCGGADFGMSNAAYVGTYQGTYRGDSQTGSTNDLSFSLTLDERGIVTGEVTESASSRTASVTGTVIDWFDPCAGDHLRVDLHFAFGETDVRTIYATHLLSKPFASPLASKYYVTNGDSATVVNKGSLVLVKQAP